MSSFQEVKAVIIAFTGLSKDALHIYVGLAVFLTTAALLRKSLHSVVLLLAVLLVAVILELGDMRQNIMSTGHWQWGDSLHDVVNTLFWPCVLALFSRRFLRGSDRA